MARPSKNISMNFDDRMAEVVDRKFRKGVACGVAIGTAFGAITVVILQRIAQLWI